MVIIVFGAALMIWGVNMFQGRNLSKAPVFDLSAYDNLNLPDPKEVLGRLKNEPAGEEKVETATDDKTALVDELKNKIETASALKQRSLYFATTFQAETPEVTKKMVDNFLQDFPFLKNAPYEDLAALKCVAVVLPVENRHDLLKTLTKQVFDESLTVLVAPNFSGCFKSPKYYESIVKILQTYPDVKWVTTAPHVQYIARLDLTSVWNNNVDAIKKLGTDFGDVVKVVE